MSAPRKPTFMFVYGTLKQGEANFNRWMGPFMEKTSTSSSEEQQKNTTAAAGSSSPSSSSPAAACGCCLRFTGPALTVHRFPFGIYDYPCVFNAPFDTLLAHRDASAAMNDVRDTMPSQVFFDTPMRVLGEVYEVVPDQCPIHSSESADLNTSRPVERLDILEGTATGLYSRVLIKAEVKRRKDNGSSNDDENVIVDAQIYFRTNGFPRNELIDMLLAAAKGTGDANESLTRADVDAIVPQLLSEDDGASCIAEGRVAAPTLRGFLRTYRGVDHHKIEERV